jgi:hemerythrin-like domain-containing protein
MNFSFPGHQAPAAGTEVPLEMLGACHERVAQQCRTLERLAAHLSSHGADMQAREAATAVMRYFDAAAPHHHADEEVDLFPALIESMAGSDAVCLRDLTAALTRDHRELEQRWRPLRAALEQVAAGAPARITGDDVAAFVGLYARHIAREEAELLPMAKRLLSDGELDRIGRAMRLRRGIASTEPDAALPTSSVSPAARPRST